MTLPVLWDKIEKQEGRMQSAVPQAPGNKIRNRERKMMLEAYRAVLEGGEGEITEKKSRLIATVRPVESEDEALAFIEEMRKKYWDARHNCFVYSVGLNREIWLCTPALTASSANT